LIKKKSVKEKDSRASQAHCFFVWLKKKVTKEKKDRENKRDRERERESEK